MLSFQISGTALIAALAGFALLSPAAENGSDSSLHFDLARSAPAVGSMVHAAPTELRLWFTEAPQDGTTTVRVMNAADERIATGDVTVDPEDKKSFGIPFTAPVKAGQYKVTWRAMGPDGHVVTGDFGFNVMIMESES